ncbi:MAG: hypothetical protein HYZ48_05415 [Chlamydiales bacterium]|nr:hypothetical protein [Chlamydiales bacterium]
MLKLTKVLNAISLIYFLNLLLSGCSGLEKSEQGKARQLNTKAEFIHRSHDETYFTLLPPPLKEQERYPWEEAHPGAHPKITKEFFRCKGSSSNPPYFNEKQTPLFDCAGLKKHSLPIRLDQEFIYPILIDLLNLVQTKTKSKVIITCGYRCPVHNQYADPSIANQSSKHTLGAEVDFFVEGFEKRPEEIIQILIDYYRTNPLYQGDKAYCDFQRFEGKNSNVSTPAWMNQEIFIKLYKSSEGRDKDNLHPHPYISVQVRFDRDSQEKVTYSWEKAFRCYRRY